MEPASVSIISFSEFAQSDMIQSCICQQSQRSCRLQMTPYFLRFLAILRSEEGRPLLNKVAQSTDRLEVLLAPRSTGAPAPWRFPSS